MQKGYEENVVSSERELELLACGAASSKNNYLHRGGGWGLQTSWFSDATLVCPTSWFPTTPTD